MFVSVWEELARVGCPMAARTPQSARFSPFAHNPRSCLGKNFAQMASWLTLEKAVPRASCVGHVRWLTREGVIFVGRLTFSP